MLLLPDSYVTHFYAFYTKTNKTNYNIGFPLCDDKQAYSQRISKIKKRLVAGSYYILSKKLNLMEITNYVNISHIYKKKKYIKL